MTTAERAEQLGQYADEIGFDLKPHKRREIAIALRELAEIRRQESGRVPSRQATAEEIQIADCVYGHIDGIEIPSDARAWETSAEVRIGVTVLVRSKR